MTMMVVRWCYDDDDDGGVSVVVAASGCGDGGDGVLVMVMMMITTSKDTEDPSWSTSIKTRRQRCHLQHWKRFEDFIFLYFVIVRNIVEYDLLYDFLKQNEVNVNASKAKRAAKAHDPLILIANTYASPSQSRSSPAYYVTHPPSMVANDSDAEPSYDSYFVDEVQDPSSSFLKGLFSKNNHAHDQQCAELEIFLRNVQIEYANTQRVSVEVKKANELLAKELETYKEQVWFFENKPENKDDYETAYNKTLNHEKKLKDKIQTQFLVEKQKDKAFEKEKHDLKTQFQKAKLVPKTVEKQVLTKLVTLQTLPQKKNVNASCDSCDVMYVSCAKSMFDNCHDKCVAKYVNSIKHKARRALCTSPLAAKTRFVDASPIAPRASLVVITHVNAKDKASSSRSKSLESLKVSTPSDTNMFMDRRNDHFAAITSYGYCVHVNITICHVYCVEGLCHNLFFVGQFYYGDLEISFRSKTCYIWNLEGDDLLSGLQESNLYTIFVSDIAALSLVCLMSKASSTKSWLWHRLLSHLNFTTINQLAKQDMVVGLPKFKYEKDHLCSACKQGKSKRALLKPKPVTSIDARLQLLPMDLCDPMRVESINGKLYILVIVDDYSCYTWVYFLRSNDEASEMFKKFITRIQVSLRAIVCYVRTDNGMDFKNEILTSFYEKLDITQQKSIARIPQRNGVVERRNRTLVEAARTMLIFSNSPDFL
ncbi:retrovirus-related pol polyprotein from transposon TNT 1-94 [Tanacetum coccineum]